ncbi:phosphate ABC transporter substrate-binding protein [uncultured Finegoldia sp.]|uniref:phosphate ABC transporter substrate-binding protein n=1 Tax=uncultured Finegoldia sp. TaxID=328009 RepID=UPI00260BA95C|nr:phosphate ABC transporter substrate-binding protein [uncultured Finegoldia sp.]
MKKLCKLLVLMMVMAIGFTGCANNNQQSKDSNQKQAESKENYEISFSGSSTLAPVISKISTNFIEKNVTWNKVDPSLPEKNITIYVSAGGSGAGVKAVLDNVANFGMLARDVKDKEKEKVKDFKEYKLGLDALTLAVNPMNKVIAEKKGNLTKEEIVKIFSGEYKKWSDLDPSLPKEDIVVVTRDLSGGAHEVFQKKVMKDVKVRQDAIQAPTMGALVAKIIENPNAIGYASFGIANQNKGKLIPLKVDGVEPTEENILNKSYYISRPLIIMKSGNLTKTEQLFIDYLNSKEGKEIIKDMGFIPSK